MLGGVKTPQLEKNMLIQATLSIQPNEKAYSLQEVHLQSPGSRGFHRYRIIIVNRDGKLAEYREDLGNIDKWRGVRCFNIPSLWEHTVGELLHIADYLRSETKIDLADWLELDKMKVTS